MIKDTGVNTKQQEEVVDLKEIILETYDDGRRETTEASQEIFDNFKSVVDAENQKWESFLEELKRLKDKKELNRSIKSTESALLKSFWTIDKEEINEIIENSDTNEKMRKYKKIKENNEKTEISYEDVLYNIMKRLYNKNLVVHGEKQRNWWIKPKSDIDWQASELLLRLCGFFKDDAGNTVQTTKRFVENGQWLKTGLHLDTSKTDNWVEVTKKIDDNWNTSLFNSKLVLDEHGNGFTSTTHIVYILLKELGKIPKKYEKQIERFVDCVDIVDSKFYSIAWADFDNLHRSMVWLHRNLPVSYVYNYFKNSKNTWFEILDEEFLMNSDNDVFIKKWETEKLKDISDKKKQSLEKSKEIYSIIENKRQLLEYNGEEFTIDIWSKVPYCPQISEYYGNGCFRLFPNGDVYVYSSSGLPKNIWWFNTDSSFLIKKMNRYEFSKLLNEFDFNEKIEWKDGIMKSIDDIYTKLENKEKEEKDKLDKINKENLIFDQKVWKCKIVGDLEVGKDYKWLVDWVLNNMVYVRLDPDHKWVVHKNRIGKDVFKNKFKWENKPNRWDEIIVKLEELSENNDRLQFSVE